MTEKPQVPAWVKAAAQKNPNGVLAEGIENHGDEFVCGNMRRYEVMNLVDEIFDAIKGYADRSFEFYAKRIERLEQTLADFGDKGVWQVGVYRKNNWVTFGGALWVAQCDTKAKPGSSDDWRLAVKRGRDGRDADPAEIAKHMLPAVLAKIEKRGA